MTRTRALLAVLLAGLTATSPGLFAANHREAPITALDHKADITDVYAFRSYGRVDVPSVTLIMCVDPLLEPANGPNWFPFDPDILYEIHVDNDYDARADVTFQFRFETEQRLPGLFQVYAGVANGAVAPSNSPPPFPPGTPIVPPRIDSFDSIGLGQRQAYSVTMVRGQHAMPLAAPSGETLFVVPANVGARTMDYERLFGLGTYSLGDHVRVFAGTTDDAFWIDLGGAFDHAGRPDEAVEVALREIGRRRDIFTLDAYAWALSAAGRHREAKAAMDEALAVGTVDSRIRGHARVIASRLEHGPGRGERP